MDENIIKVIIHFIKNNHYDSDALNQDLKTNKI